MNGATTAACMAGVSLTFITQQGKAKVKSVITMTQPKIGRERQNKNRCSVTKMKTFLDQMRIAGVSLTRKIMVH